MGVTSPLLSPQLSRNVCMVALISSLILSQTGERHDDHEIVIHAKGGHCRLLFVVVSLLLLLLLVDIHVSIAYLFHAYISGGGGGGGGASVSS